MKIEITTSNYTVMVVYIFPIIVVRDKCVLLTRDDQMLISYHKNDFGKSSSMDNYIINRTVTSCMARKIAITYNDIGEVRTYNNSKHPDDTLVTVTLDESWMNKLQAGAFHDASSLTGRYNKMNYSKLLEIHQITHYTDAKQLSRRLLCNNTLTQCKPSLRTVAVQTNTRTMRSIGTQTYPTTDVVAVQTHSTSTKHKSFILLFHVESLSRVSVVIVDPVGYGANLSRIHGSFSLPGGGIEQGESPFASAIREFKEETECPLPAGAMLFNPILYRRKQRDVYIYPYRVMSRQCINEFNDGIVEIKSCKWMMFHKLSSSQFRPILSDYYYLIVEFFDMLFHDMQMLCALPTDRQHMSYSECI